MLTRRVFLKGSAVVMTGVGTAPLWLARTAAAAEGKRKLLVAIFLRGAADGLNLVVPFAEKRYYELRPSIAVPAPSGQPNGSIDLDGRFALNPGMQPLKALWDSGQLAIVEGAGSPDPSRSHFEAQDFMESGTPGTIASDGWMNRALNAPGPETSPLRAISLGAQIPRTLRGSQSAIALNDTQTFQMPAQNTALLEAMYSRAGDPRLERTSRGAFDAMRMLRSLGNTQANRPAAQYAQAGPFGRSLQQIAQLIKADAGVEAAFAELGGWDHHGNEPGQINNLARQLSSGLAGFCQDMGDRMEDIVVVTMSEFGRTARENGNNGTDHGHGNVMFVVGGPVAGGKVYGDWPGLEQEQLYEGRDLAVTTDFRSVLAELVGGHLGQRDLNRVFPGFERGAPLGLLRSA